MKSQNKRLLTDDYSEEIGGRVFQSNVQLLNKTKTIFPSPPTPTSPDEFFNHDVSGKAYLADRDINYSAIWRAQQRQCRSFQADELSLLVGEALSAGEGLLKVLNLEALDEASHLIRADLDNESESFEHLHRQLFGRPAQIFETGGVEFFRSYGPVNNITHLYLFAWQIPHLFPDNKARSWGLGRVYWTLFALRVLVRWDAKPERNECPRKENAPWVSMRHLGRVLFPEACS